MSASKLRESNVTGFPVRRGKVRDIYEISATMLAIVATDRISAFDYVLDSIIPDKGKILTQMSLFWADLLDVPYHIAHDDRLPDVFRTPEFAYRTMCVDKAKVIPFECVVRGFLCGSGWKDYQKTGEVCGIKLPKGLKENQQFPKAIFTPATKAETGHDENISFKYMADAIGVELTSELEQRSLDLYNDAADHAWKQGIIIADTKFEWGTIDGVVTLIDEVMTPDSSRFWALDKYRLGSTMPSFDKQGVRNWLEKSGWDKESPPPALPAHVVRSTRLKYLEAYKRLTGKELCQDVSNVKGK